MLPKILPETGGGGRGMGLRHADSPGRQKVRKRTPFLCTENDRDKYGVGNKKDDSPPGLLNGQTAMTW